MPGPFVELEFIVPTSDTIEEVVAAMLAGVEATKAFELENMLPDGISFTTSYTTPSCRWMYVYI